MAKYIININLDEIHDAHALDNPADMIHQKELYLIAELFKDSIDKVTKADKEAKQNTDTNSVIANRVHDTITISGGRGSGKSTFLLSLMRFITNNTLSNEQGKTNFADNIEILGVLDPTLIEDNEHVFINIISRIKTRVDTKYTSSNCCDWSQNNETTRQYQDWQESLRNLAEGLPSIKEVGNNPLDGDGWLDSEFIMDQGLRRARSANDLEKNFHTFVRKSLGVLNKKAFLLCFDDIDTDFARGWPVLETLHKYLTTIRFISILSGDLELYSVLVQNQQVKNFSNEFFRLKDAETACDTLVRRLESQFMLKLLKPERRLFLTSLTQKENTGDYSKIIVKGSKLPKKGQPLRDTCLNIIKRLGIYGSAYQESLYRFITAIPLRSLIQLLQALINHNDKENYWCIADIFMSDLSHQGIDISTMRNHPQKIVTLIIEYLNRNNIIQEGYTLLPIFSDLSINSVQFALSASFSKTASRNPALLFDYWLRVCLTREIAGLLQKGTYSTDKPSGLGLGDYIEHCAITSDRSLRHIARTITAFTRSSSLISHPDKSWHGTVPLYAMTAKPKNNSKTPCGIITQIQKQQATTAQRILINLPLSLVTDHKNYTLPIYSFFSLLGVIGELSQQIDGIEKNITEIILKNAQPRSYPTPQGSQIVQTDSIAHSVYDEEDFDLTQNTEFKSLTQAISQWLKNYIKTELTVSPALLGRIFTRFFYIMNNIDSKKTAGWNLGDWIHRMIVAFLHSVLVVEAMERCDINETGIQLTNPVLHDTIFISNLGKLVSHRKSLPFSLWMLSCPLWQAYLAPDSDVPKSLIDFTDKPLLYSKTQISVYKILQSVPSRIK